VNKLLLSLLLIVYFSVLLSPQNAFAQTITVNTDKLCYVERDTITVFGSVSEIIPDTLVQIGMISSIGNLVALRDLEIAPDGRYTVDISSGGPLWQSEGTYIVRSVWTQLVPPQSSFTIADTETTFEYNFNTCPQIVGGEIILIDTTSLILAGTQSFSWMIPLVLSVLGIGLFVVSRKSENS